MTGKRRLGVAGAAVALAAWGQLAAGVGARAQNAPAPLPPEQAARGMTVPEGFSVQVFAAEPDVRQPIALTFDPRGRLWVAECYSYPDWEKNGRPGRDRVLIFEDTDGDGRFDRRTVFWDKGANVSGLEVGFGGVWVCATPNLLFLPDRDGDDRPDGPAEVVLDGWDLNARHNVVNGLTWGPDGWLWGCNGILSNSRVGPPGTPDARRTAINCGVWRYHPTRKTFETVANGTTNPWGLDFDDYGEAFLTNCVIPHLFHAVPGARFQRMFGEDFNKHAYGLMGSCADHVHWDTVEAWSDIRARGVTPTTDVKGGGHAHSGAMVYLGDNWPDRYRNGVFTVNIHGRRVNHDTLERSGSGYRARHAPDFLRAGDPWFRGVALKAGPDGSVYVLDWSDTGECHEDDADGAHRENGRIYRVAYGTPKPVKLDLAGLTDVQLVGLQKQKNDWYVRQARRVLQERAEAGRPLGSAGEALRAMLADDPDVTRKLRALWALHAAGLSTENDLVRLLGHKEEHLRAWAVRLLVDDRDRPPSAGARQALTGLALPAADPSPKVRLALASALPRLPAGDREVIALGLMKQAGDARDPNLPLMIWYGVEPMVPDNPLRAAAWATFCQIPQVRRNLARRAVAADVGSGLAAVVDRLGREREVRGEVALDMLRGADEALRGRRSVPRPDGWPALADRLDAVGRADLRGQTVRLSLLFGDPEAVARLRTLVADPSATAAERRGAVGALAEARVPGLVADLVKQLADPAVRGAALRALAAYDDPSIPRAVLDRYKTFPPADRDDAVATLAARPSWALALLDAVARGEVPRRDVSPAVARQVQAFGRKDVDEALARAWGTLRPAARDKAARMARYKALLTPDALKAADRARGREVFQRSCRQCHRLYQDGGDVGPDLTGSNRDNLDYVLENVLDPGAVVGNDYKLTNVATADGRLVSGILKEQTAAALVVQTANDRVVIPRGEVEEVKPSPSSMMPEGLFEALTDEEVRDLVAYLAAKDQAP